jgi:hypothetical protein
VCAINEESLVVCRHPTPPLSHVRNGAGGMVASSIPFRASSMEASTVRESCNGGVGGSGAGQRRADKDRRGWLHSEVVEGSICNANNATLLPNLLFIIIFMPNE